MAIKERKGIKEGKKEVRKGEKEKEKNLKWMELKITNLVFKNIEIY
jgi:hypothetical protein